MIRKTLKTDRERRGVILVLSALMMVALVGLVAFAVDYGYLLKMRTDLQRSADAAALAAVQDLIRKPDGTQDLSTARATAANTQAPMLVIHHFKLRQRISNSDVMIQLPFIPTQCS